MNSFFRLQLKIIAIILIIVNFNTQAQCNPNQQNQINVDSLNKEAERLVHEQMNLILSQKVPFTAYVTHALTVNTKELLTCLNKKSANNDIINLNNFTGPECLTPQFFRQIKKAQAKKLTMQKHAKYPRKKLSSKT